MFAAIFCKVLLLGQISFLPLAQANPLVLQQAAPATQPTTQPAAPGSGSPIKGLWDLTSRQVTVHEILDPTFWRNVLSQLAVEAIGLVPRIVVAFVFLVFFWLVYRMIRRVVLGGMNKAKVDTSIRDMLTSLVKWAIMGFGLVIAFNQIGIQITALLTGVSIIGLAIGFAAQETLSNFIAGIVIFWDKPFRIGDWIELENTYGQVLRITFRSTRVLSLSGEVIVLPNTFMLSNRLSNHSTNPINRVRVEVGIAYSASIDAARKVLLKQTEGDPRICAHPAPSVGVLSLGDSSVNLGLSFWIQDESVEKVIAAEYREKVKKALDEAGIQIPFPHLQLFLEDTPALRTLAGANGPAAQQV